MNLSVQALCFSNDTAPLLRDIRFSLDTGSFVCVLGENGAGKSTLFQCILNLQKNYTGQISLDRQNIKTLNERELAKFIAYIPQLHKQSFAFSVFDTVLMGTSASLSPFSMPKEKQREAALEALRLMNMEKYASRSCSAFHPQSGTCFSFCRQRACFTQRKYYGTGKSKGSADCFPVRRNLPYSHTALYFS